MRIVYLHQYFATPQGKTGTRSYEFAKRWIKAGIDVTIITSPAQLTDRELAEAERISRNLRKLIIDDIEVLVVDAEYHQTMSYSSRIKSFLKFSISATQTLLKIDNVDLIYATSTPLTIAIPAILKYKFHKVPFVFEVRDLWPLVPIALGIIKNPIIKKALFSFERYIYRHAKGIVALSPDMKTYIDKITNKPEKTIVAPNCADINLFKPASIDKRQALRKKFSWLDRFVIVHSGAMGRVNGLYRIIEQAKRLKADFGERIIFVFIGEGREKSHLLELVRLNNIKNVEFIEPMAKHHLAEVLSAVDVGLVSVDRIKELEYNSANKFFDYLAAGLPVLLNYDGWQKEILEKYGAGLGVDDFDEEMFRANIIKLYENSELCKTMSLNARKLAEMQFNRDMIAKRILDFLLPDFKMCCGR